MRRSISAVLAAISCVVFLQSANATTNVILNAYFTGPVVPPPPWGVSGTSGGVGVSFVSNYVSMGNYADAFQYVYQTFTFPTNMIGATLGLYNQTLSSNPNGDDYLTIYLGDTSLDPLLRIGNTISSANGSATWYSGSDNFIEYQGSNILSTFAGQTVDLVFYVQTGANGSLTSFNITDVSLIVGTTADIPVNDDFTNATVIPPAGYTNLEFNTTYASREAGEADILKNPGGHSLWYSWTPSANGTAAIGVNNNDFTTLLGVYTGTSISNLTLVSSYDGIRNSSGTSLATFVATAGTTYYITVDGYSGQSGVAYLTVKLSEDKTPPRLAITSPANNADVTSNSVIIRGTASDNVAVAYLQYRLQNSVTTNAWQTPTGSNTWTATVTNLIPGPNTIVVQAVDTSGNETTVTHIVNYIVTSPLTLDIVGNGKVTGATNSQRLAVGETYTLTPVPAAGFAFSDWTGDISTNTSVLKFVMQPNFSLTANFVDDTKPTLTITSPKLRSSTSNSVQIVTGTAMDNVGVASVWYNLNAAGWTQLSGDVATSDNWTNWTVSVSPTPGPNTLSAYAVDAAGNKSVTNTVTFTYILSTTLVIDYTGSGTVTPNYNNTLLAIGNTYSMTAKPSSGFVFSNWTTEGGSPISTSATLKFTMASNLVYVANFVQNPYLTPGGTYNGLFYANDVEPGTSGFVTVQVGTNGLFTAKFTQGAKTYSVSGVFSLTGGWSTNSLKTWNGNAISLQLDLDGGSEVIGAVGDSAVKALRETYSKTNAAPQAGKYTLVIPPYPTTGVGGYGFGSVVVTSTGGVTLSGTLGDGTKVTPSAILAGAGEWPLYISLDSGNGMLLGWLEFTNLTDRDITGEIDWIRPAQSTAATYKTGITNDVEVAGSAYKFTTGEPVLDLTTGTLSLTGGGLDEEISDTFTLAANSAVTGTGKLKLTFTTSTGLFSGSTTNSAGKTVSFSGAVLQKQNQGFGLFINGAQTGSVNVAPE